MLTARVLTNLTCNQNCTYCNSRQPADERAFLARDAVLGRIDGALAGGVVEIVFTGGEPTMRRDLPLLVAHARSEGAASVTLETNATLIDAATSRELAAAGVSLARVNLAGGDSGLDRVTRDPGGFERARVGIEALLNAGIPVEIAVAVVRSTAPRLAALPAAVAGDSTTGPRPRAIYAHVPVDAPDPSELLSYEEATKALVALDTGARRAGIPLRLAPDGGPPPCMFPSVARAAHLYSLTAGARQREDFEHVQACGDCLVADRCSGLPRLYLSRHAPPRIRPITQDHNRRRLSLASSVEEQVSRELVTPNRREMAGVVVKERIVRVNFHCNQACRFCFVSTHLPPASVTAVERAIRDAADAGARIVLSGGEPTLNPKVVDYVRLAKQSSQRVELQTNAVRLEDAALASELAEAGLDEAFVSLHGSRAGISDKVTGAPGTFERTVAGIDNVARTRIHLTLNFVICQTNFEDLVPFVRMVGLRWPHASINISFVAASTDVVPRDRELVPRYSDVLPHVAAAIVEARSQGVEIGGFASMCGIPLCLVPEEFGEHYAQGAIPEGFDGGEFVYPEACATCDLAQRCYGVRRSYADLHGIGELRPVRAAAIM